MRPVQRGAEPSGAKTYEAMRPTLVARLGCYCSYCELPVSHVPHAEHIVPKDRFPAWRDRWDNLLVSCTWCNSYKGDERPPPEKVDEYLWPTRDNTARAFSYASIIPRVSDMLEEPLRSRAARLRGLVRLAVTGDTRGKARAEAYNLAKRYASKLSSAKDPELLRESIVDIAVATGFFSVWMEVFSGDLVIRRGLIASFVGTARDCFEPATTAPVMRPGGCL